MRKPEPDFSPAFERAMISELAGALRYLEGREDISPEEIDQHGTRESDSSGCLIFYWKKFPVLRVIPPEGRAENYRFRRLYLEAAGTA